MTRNDRKLPGSLSILICIFVFAELAIGGMAKSTERESLRGKSDAELLRLVIGGRNDAQKRVDESVMRDVIPVSAIDRVWEMAPEQAALALAAQYLEKEARGKAKFRIDLSNKVALPPGGEVGISWISGNEYALPEHGLIVLHDEGIKSRLSLSDFQIIGSASQAELRDALARVDDHPLRPAVARRTYEIIWWLSRVRRVGDRAGGTSVSSADDLCESFWIKPGGPFLVQALLGTPNGEDLNENEFSSLPAFAYQLLQRLMTLEKIKPRRPLPTIGTPTDANPDAAFLRLHPAPESHDAKVVDAWCDRMLAILKNPERYKMHDDVLFKLVPIEAPNRYKYAAIDQTLRALVLGSDEAASLHKQAAEGAEQEIQKINQQVGQSGFGEELKEKEKMFSSKHGEEESAIQDIHSAANLAGKMLGFRDDVDFFPELLRRGKNSDRDAMIWNNDCLTGAAEIAGKHPKFQPDLVSYLKSQLENIGQSQMDRSQLFECVWRADARTLKSELEQVATSSPDENEDAGATTSPAPAQGSGKFHAARIILMAWKEPDALTKTKIDAMINGYVCRSDSISEVVLSEFEKLSSEDQLAIRNFITWLRTVEVPWSRTCLEDVFTPHTPRPDDDLVVLPEY